MGNMGSGFAQGFANTIQTLGPVIQRNQQERESLELQKKLASASLEKHTAETALLTQKLLRDQGWRDMLLNGVPTQTQESDAFGLPMPPTTTRQPFDRNNEQHRRVVMALDPDYARDEFKQDRKIQMGIEGMARLPQMMAAARGAQGSQGPQAPAPQPGNMLAGPGAPTGTPEAPSAPGAPPLGQITSQETSVTFDPADGSMKLTFRDSPVKWEVKDGTAQVNGRFQMVRDFINPTNGETHRVLQGPPLPPESVQRFALVAESYGLQPGTPTHAAAVSELAAASALPGEMQAQALAAIEARYKALSGLGGNVAGSAIKASRQAAIEDATTKAAAQVPIDVAKATAMVPIDAAKAKAVKESTESVPEKPTEGSRDKLAGDLTAAAKLSQIGALYKPEFTGPLRGGAGARFREVTGSMATQEQNFRTAVQDYQNAAVKEITGVSFPESQAQRIIGQLPDPNLPPKQFEARLAQTKINQKVIAIQRRRVLEATGVDVSKVPQVKLSAQEQQMISAPIVADYQMGQIDRAEAAAQLQGLAQYAPATAMGILDVIDRGKKR